MRFERIKKEDGNVKIDFFISWADIIISLIGITIISFVIKTHASTNTTTTTLTPNVFSKNFIDLCKVKTANLPEPYKTKIKQAQEDAHCQEN